MRPACASFLFAGSILAATVLAQEPPGAVTAAATAPTTVVISWSAGR